jgi:hypothetical protein
MDCYQLKNEIAAATVMQLAEQIDLIKALCHFSGMIEPESKPTPRRRS